MNTWMARDGLGILVSCDRSPVNSWVLIALRMGWNSVSRHRCPLAISVVMYGWGEVTFAVFFLTVLTLRFRL